MRPLANVGCWSSTISVKAIILNQFRIPGRQEIDQLLAKNEKAELQRMRGEPRPETPCCRTDSLRNLGVPFEELRRQAGRGQGL